MKRRTFLKSSAILGTSILVVPNITFAQANNPFGINTTPRKFSVVNSFLIEPSEEVTQLWIPLPLEESYQHVAKIAYEGNYKEAYISNENPNNTKILYVKWEKGTQNRELTVNLDIVTQSRSVNFNKANASVNYPQEVKEYLKGTEHTPVNQTVTTFVKDIVKESKTPLQKAQAIYDWTVLNMYRDESVKGCGVGDAMRTIQDKIFGGKCTDISSVFVSLLRNAGIPAREVFGIRVGQSKISNACGKADENGFATVSGGQHCRAEFYISGLGWVPADPADVTKVRLAEKLTNEDKKVQDVKAYMFGAWEMNWMAFNYARDFILTPKPTQFPLNMLGYPYAEVGEDAKDYYDPKTFSYTYTSQERI